MSRIRALACPLCGGAVAAPTTSRRAACRYCGRPLLYTGPSFTPTLAIPPRLDDAALQRICSTLFHHPLVPRGLAGGSVLVRKRRKYIPFYLLSGTRGGILAVGRERSRQRASVLERGEISFADGTIVAKWSGSPSGETVVEEDSRVILGDFRYAYAAASLDELGPLDSVLRDMVLSHGEHARPVALGTLARDADVVNPDLPLERIVEKGVGTDLAVKGSLEVLEMIAAVVYLPVVTLSFRWGIQRFSVTLEEVEGRVLAGSLPFRKSWGYGIAVPIVAAMGLVLGNALAQVAGVPGHDVASSPGLAKFAALSALLLLVPLAMGLQAAWMVLRAPLVVRVTPGGPRVESAGELPRNPFAPVNALVRWCVEAFAKRERGGWGTP